MKPAASAAQRFRRNGTKVAAIFTLLAATTACHHSESARPLRSGDLKILSRYDIPLPDVVDAIGIASNDDGRLFILDSSGPFYLYLVDLNRRAVTGKFARAGEGPGELSGPESLQLVRDPTPHLWIMEPNRRLMIRFDITADPVFSGAVRFESRIPIFKALMLPSGLVVSGAIRNGAALTAGDSTFHSQRPWGKAPYLPEDLPPVLVFDANWAYSAANPQQSKVATAFKFAAEIQIIDSTGRTLNRIFIPNGVGHPNIVSPRFNTNFVNDTSDIAYLAIAASDSTIVAVYCGCHGRLRYAEAGPLQVQIYRWDGTLVGTDTVNKHITSVAVSPDGHTVYYVANSPDPTLTVLNVRFQSNEIHQ